MTKTFSLLRGDCMEQLKRIPDNKIDAIVTDPPYGLTNTDPKHVIDAITHWASGDRGWTPPVSGGFMGKTWDSFVPPPAVWDECFRVLKPGGHLLSFAGTRTFDLMTLSIRFSGFDIRDSIAWLYGSGFPKSMNISKAIDKAAGAEREVVGQYASPEGTTGLNSKDDEYGFGVGDMSKRLITAPATPEAAQWEGWGTALKPAFEPIVVARKPLSEKTVAANVLLHGTGALNIDASRISTSDKLGGGAEKQTTNDQKNHEGWQRPWMDDPEMQAAHAERVRANVVKAEDLGRFPANVILDESQAAALDEQSGTLTSGKPGIKRKGNDGPAYGAESRPPGTQMPGFGDSGGASRFFYQAKAPKSERPVVDGVAHPTVKPLTLMSYLVKLVTPPGGLVLDPFAGSGTTMEAAVAAGFRTIGIEVTEEYWPLIEARMKRVEDSP